MLTMMMIIMLCVAGGTLLTAVNPVGSGSGTSGVIPLSVEMISDSDDEDARKPPPRLITSAASAVSQPAGAGLGSAGPASGIVDGKSKLLLLKMASEFVEAEAAAAAAASLQTPVNSKSFDLLLLQ